MTARLLAHIMSGLYLATLLGWSVIIMWGKERAWRALAGRAQRGDWVAAAMVLLGVALVAAMLLYLTGTMTEFRRGMVLVGVAAAPIVIMFSYSHAASDGHKRAVTWCFAAVLGLAFVAGAIV